jgi:dienelactone hydrolase
MSINCSFRIIIIYFCLYLSGLSVSAQVQVRNTIWNGEDFLCTPACRVVKEDSIRSLIFESVSYKGQAKSVFAYYATPAMLQGNSSQEKKLPGIILVHGGGGTAFREWVVMWAKRGYAALALDTRGNDPDKKHIDGGFDENEKETPYFDVTLPQKEQWVYQAVSDIFNAHSLLLSFPEVDVERTAITGISWGGVLTCIAASLDSRFRVAVPVYGCGFLSESGRMKQQLDGLPDEQREIWLKQYDPSNYLPRMERPILFINGTNDVHFYLPSMARSAVLASQSGLLIKQGLRHSHKYGWQSEEIAAFIDQYLRDVKPLAQITNEKVEEGLVLGEIISSTPVEKATLHYTTDSGQEREKYHWQAIESKVEKNKWRIPLPAGITTWYVNITDVRGYQISGELHIGN